MREVENLHALERPARLAPWLAARTRQTVAVRFLDKLDDLFRGGLRRGSGSLLRLRYFPGSLFAPCHCSSPRSRCWAHVLSDDDLSDDDALFLAQHALRVEIADTTALAAGSRVDDRIDERRLAGIHCRVDGAFELIRGGGIGADPAERLDHLVVARAFDEYRGRRVGAAAAIDVGAAIDAVIVEDYDADRQPVAADRFDLHAGEAEGAVAFDRQHRLAGLDRGADGITHADAHDAPSPDVEPLARLVHVDDPAGEIEGVGAFIDQDRVRALLDDRAQHAERAVIIHRRIIVHQPRRHLGDVLFALALDRVDPIGRRRRPFRAHRVEQRIDAGADIADHRSGDLDIGSYFLGLDIDLDEFFRMRLAPALALAVRQQPVQPRADQHHDVGILEHGRARRAGALWMGIRQQAFGHAHRQERNAGFFDERADLIVGLCIGGALAENDQGTLGAFE